MARKLRSLSVRGATGSNRARLEAVTRLPLNTQFTKASVRSAVQRIMATGLIDSVRVSGEKTGHLVFSVKELPIIQSISFYGNSGLKRDALQREVTVELEKPLSPDRLKRDVARIVELYASQGLERPLVKVFTEASAGNRADLTIAISEHGLPFPEEPARRRARKRKRENIGATASLEALPRPVAAADGERPAGVHDADIATRGEEGPVQARAPTPARQMSPEADVDLETYSANWTGRFRLQDHVRVVHALAPRVMSEIDTLVRLVEAERFNDPETEAALELLRSLHRDLGKLIEAVDIRKDRPLLVRIARKNARLVRFIKTGAKVGVVAPALTIGISHLLSVLTRVPIDSTMVSTVFATMIAMPIVERQIEQGERKP